MSTQPVWLAQRERGSALLMRAIVRFTLVLGRTAGRALLYPICLYFVSFSRGARKASRAYLARVLPRRPKWIDLYRHQLCFARTILDRAYVMSRRLEQFDCTFEGVDALRARIAQRQGCLLFGAHFGSFDFLRVIGMAESAVRVNVLMHEANARKMNAVLAELDPQLPTQVIALGRPHTMLQVAEALRRGELVALLADRVVTGDKMVPCTFLGDTAHFPEGPFVLAAMLRAPVVLFAAIYEGASRYRIVFEPFAERIEPSACDPKAAFAAHCQRYADWLADNCRRHPFNWFNFYDFWAGAASRRSDSQARGVS